MLCADGVLRVLSDRPKRARADPSIIAWTLISLSLCVSATVAVREVPSVPGGEIWSIPGKMCGTRPYTELYGVLPPTVRRALPQKTHSERTLVTT